MARDSKLWAEAYAATPKPKKWTKVKHIKKVDYKAPVVVVEGLEAKKDRIRQIDLLIKKLRAERKELVRRTSPAIDAYEKKPWVLYALKLEGGCYYIGISRNVTKRFAQHQKGKGAAWTRLHKPIGIIETRPTTLTQEAEASILENDMTFEYARMYGVSRVRGGGYCQTKPQWPIEAYHGFDNAKMQV